MFPLGRPTVEYCIREKCLFIMRIMRYIPINNVCGQKAEFLVLNVAVYAQNIAFEEKTAWTLQRQIRCDEFD
jgi:hypothetical protein